jgi:hypothetical protein
MHKAASWTMYNLEQQHCLVGEGMVGLGKGRCHSCVLGPQWKGACSLPIIATLLGSPRTNTLLVRYSAVLRSARVRELPTPMTRGSRTVLTLEGSAKRWEAGPRQISSKGDLLDSIWVGAPRLNSVVDAAQRKSL